jgi:DNA polymerase-3 subunit delta'
LRGQDRAVGLLRAALESGRLAHGYLLTGPEGVGKRALARELVKAVLCEGGDGSDACDACRSCRAVDSGNSWEYTILGVEAARGEFRPVEDSDREIKVASIRAVERELSVKASAGRPRAVLIPGAERMNEEAQNALLKTLEEPAGSRLLVLTSSRPQALLPTVISRLARVRLRPLSAEEVASHLVEARGMNPADARELAAASGGSIGAALRSDLEEVRAARGFVEREVGAAAGTGALALADRMMEFARENSGSGKGLEPVRRQLLALLRAAARLYRGRLQSDVQSGAGSAAVRRHLEAVLKAQVAVAAYASPELVCRVFAAELIGT